jgi:uncharacterized protein (UPF0276 family)
MPRLTVNYSQALQGMVLAGEQLPMDGVEVGPWFSVEEIERARQRLPGWLFHLHMGSLISRVRYRPGTIKRLKRYLSCTENEWLSAHIELLPLARFLLGSRLGIYLARPDVGQAVERFVRTLERVTAATGMPMVLENLSSLPASEYAYAAEPAILSEVLEASDSGLLLDLAHARLAAAYRGQAPEAYVSALPLDRVRQIHVSGIRMRNGRWYDAHESLQEEDYRLLAWALERCDPVMVTLEYFRQEAPLREQIGRLGEVLAV